MRTIVVVNSKGGCGKTTIATNLAGHFAKRGVRTALVDLDPQQSSLEWLAARPGWRPSIHGVDGQKGSLHLPRNTQVTIIDSPARVHGRQLSDIVRRADLVVVPVLPSPIDIRAAGHFITGDLLHLGALKGKSGRIALVANRVRENAKIFSALQTFLRRQEIRHVGTLRDTQNYIRAAAMGLSIFELAPSLVARDLDQWRPLTRWVSRTKL
ncbi:MAG: ParA family protein [Gammaproteobacteria bacterium]|jgi:chromosome partitioning protein|nr:ParA family protein [Gammaproteobacteria bacterium]